MTNSSKSTRLLYKIVIIRRDITSDPIQEAVKKFSVPTDHEEFLFTLPAFYVANADRKISMKEAFSISFNAILSGLVPVDDGAERRAFQHFCSSNLMEFIDKTGIFCENCWGGFKTRPRVVKVCSINNRKKLNR